MTAIQMFTTTKFMNFQTLIGRKKSQQTYTVYCIIYMFIVKMLGLYSQMFQLNKHKSNYYISTDTVLHYCLN
jgi:Ca2+/H+ antiporter